MTAATAIDIDHPTQRKGFVERRRYPREGGTKPVDFGYLKRFTFGNRELEREVLYLFSQNAPIYIARLRDATTQKAWHDAAHTLKGSARAVGAWRLARAAEMAEKLRYEIDRDRCQFAIDVIAEATAEATRFVVEIFPEA
jgi:HPt (histidine-containing phosphotransfer) domain-containing protein